MYYSRAATIWGALTPKKTTDIITSTILCGTALLDINFCSYHLASCDAVP